MLLQKGQFLQQNLDATKKRIASLQEQLRVLEKINKQSSICEDELKDVIRHSVTIAEDSKEKHQTTVMQVNLTKVFGPLCFLFLLSCK